MGPRSTRGQCAHNFSLQFSLGSSSQGNVSGSKGCIRCIRVDMDESRPGFVLLPPRPSAMPRRIAISHACLHASSPRRRRVCSGGCKMGYGIEVSVHFPVSTCCQSRPGRHPSLAKLPIHPSVVSSLPEQPNKRIPTTRTPQAVDMFRRSASKRNVSSLGNGTPSNPAESVSSNLSDQGGSKASSLLVAPNDMETVVNGERGEGKAPVPKRRTSLR